LQAYTGQLVTYNSFINFPTNSAPVGLAARSLSANPTYYYTWTGACTGSSSTCTRSFNSSGVYAANLSVTIGGVTKTANCSTTIQNSACGALPCAN
jgi:hypothetical protein